MEQSESERQEKKLPVGRPAITRTTLNAKPAAKSASRSSLASETTLSVCSLSSSSQATVSSSQQRRAPIKKSVSSLSSSSTTTTTASTAAMASTRRSPAASGPVAPGAISFSGIRRPPTASKKCAPSVAPPAAPTSSSSPSSSSSSSSAVSGLGSRTSTLTVSLREKDQQIKLLIKERDEKKFQAELMARQVQEWRDKFEASELERSHMTSEADDEVVELRRLAQEFEDENKSLRARLSEREQAASELQFKLVELQCENGELSKEMELCGAELKQLEGERADLLGGQKSGAEIVTGRAISKAKYEKEIEELGEKLTSREEQMMQLRSSLEMRKQELQALQQHTGELERKLRIESERSERHLKRIDEVNLELKAADAKLATKAEENEIQEKQIKQLRHELRQAEEKLEQVSLARKKDVDVLHSKLSAARRRSTTPNGSSSSQQQSSSSSAASFKTPTPQDEIVRLQMELRDLKDQLIDREAELDCNRRDLEVMRRKMETRTLEVDCNNQELARRCQDLLEQNRQSEDTIKQLLRSTTEHSASLMRATEDLKEANGKCLQLREQINQLETKLEQQVKLANEMERENKSLLEENEERVEQVEMLRNQVESLNEQIGELCEQLDKQTGNLHKDREMLADQLSEREIQAAQLRQELASARQDLRTQRLQQQEICTERDCLKCDLELKEKYIKSRNEVLETMRLELDDCKRSLAEHKLKLEALRTASQCDLNACQRELKSQAEAARRELQLRADECQTLRNQCLSLEGKLDELEARRDSELEGKFAEMRRKHSEELDQLHLRIRALESELEEARTCESATISAQNNNNNNNNEDYEAAARRREQESEIEFLNSVVVDMQRKCDAYRAQLAQLESQQQQPAAAATAAALGSLDRLLRESSPLAATLDGNATFKGASKTLGRPAALTRQRVVRIQDPLDELLREASQEAAARRPTRHISGRPYCDICQLYDAHHTIHCTKLDKPADSPPDGAQVRASCC